jgi:tetratricopeptide (TPR) repeat protein
MFKYFKIIILIILLAAAGVFLYQKFGKKAPTPGNDLEAMKKNIIADPQVNAPTLADEQKNKFLAEFKTAKEAVLASNFDTLQGVNNVAMAKQHLGDFDGAIIAWEYANIIRPKNSLSFSNLAALYHYDLKQFDKAEENYKISLENDPADLPTWRNFYDLYHYSLKDDKKAEGLLLQAIGLNPEMADLYSLVGSFYKDIGNLPKALEYYEKHLELVPNNSAVKSEVDRLK